MEAPIGAPTSSGSESRISRGWRITRASWLLIRGNTAILGLTALGIVGAGLAAFLVFFAGGVFSSGDDAALPPAVLGALAVYPCVLVGTFFNVAVALAASAALDGERISAREALRMARGKLGAIAGWSLIAAIVGVLLREIAERLPGGGRLLVRLVGAAWGLATIFVVPIIAIEGGNPMGAIRRSAGLVKQRWGEGITGSVAIGAIGVLLAVPGLLLFCLGAALVGASPAAGVACIVLGLASLVAAVVYATATRQVFAVALYRYAIDAPVGGFSAWDLQHPFAERGSRRRSWLRVSAAVVAVILFLTIVGALLVDRDRRAPTASNEFRLTYPASYAADFAPGMPVVLRGGRQIGAVTSSEVESGRLFVDFYVRSDLRPFVASHQAAAMALNGERVIVVGGPP